MASRDDILILLAARRRGFSLRPEVPPGPTPSWRAWLSRAVRMDARMPAMPEVVALMRARPMRPLPQALLPRGRLQAFRMLFLQGWDEQTRETRGLRFGALTVSLLLNGFFAALLVWLMYLRFLALSAPPEGEAVRIRIVGLGTPEATGGGSEPAPGASNAAAASASRPATRSDAMPSTQAADASAEEAAQPVAQPLATTESNRPDDFELPPTRRMDVAEPETAPLLARQLPEVDSIPAPLPTVRSLQSSERMPELRIPSIAQAVEPIRERIELPDLSTRGLSAPLPAGELRQGMPTARALPGERSGNGAVPASAAGAGSAAPAAGTAPGTQSRGSGAGPETASRPGAWPSPRRGDDWGDAARNRAGQASGSDRGDARGQGDARNGSGLFNADGSPRLAGDEFKPRFPDPYKEGTWLKRPSLGYRATMFDGIWRPSETLLQEWVRKGIKSISIPIPGTDMELQCTISVLQAMGGCLPMAGKNGKFDQPARARKPPDTPFKPRLHENPEDLTPRAEPQAEPPPGQDPAVPLARP